MIRILHGDCLMVLPTLDADSIDSCVTDPPYHLASIVKRFGSSTAAPAKGNDAYIRASKGFMGKTWDGGDIASRPETWAAVFRVLKPGAYLLTFGGTRTFHRMACAIEDAGFEIRDTCAWLYGSGFPKSHDPGNKMDREMWDETEWYESGERSHRSVYWSQFGTALKPAFEPIIVARKPLGERTVAANVLRHGTGAINIDACRVPSVGALDETESKTKNRHADFESGPRDNAIYGSDGRDRSANGNYDPPGRWPANVLHDGSDEVLAAFAVYGEKNGGHHPSARGRGNISTEGHGGQAALIEHSSDQGSAARFFYTAKADGGDRAGSKHPTVKPTDLMRWLVRLVTPPGGTVLDPFCGTGSTLLAADQQQFHAIGIEQDATYTEDARRKLLQDAPLFTQIATPAPAPRSRLFT